MDIGDKVRLKSDYINGQDYLVKGNIGKILFIDFYYELAHIEFSYTTVRISLLDLNNICELIRNDPKAKVPKVLMNWYKQTEAFMGGNND